MGGRLSVICWWRKQRERESKPQKHNQHGLMCWARMDLLPCECVSKAGGVRYRHTGNGLGLLLLQHEAVCFRRSQQAALVTGAWGGSLVWTIKPEVGTSDELRIFARQFQVKAKSTSLIISLNKLKQVVFSAFWIPKELLWVSIVFIQHQKKPLPGTLFCFIKTIYNKMVRLLFPRSNSSMLYWRGSF